jgi:putative lumazine-binding protein
MKTTVVFGLCLLGLGSTMIARVSDGQDADEAAIREVVQLYFDGIIKYDEDSLRKAFHPQANIIGTTDAGQADWEPFQQWVLYTRGEAPDSTGRLNRIISIDITGRAAIAKTDLDWPHVHYVDYLSLLKIEGEWRIVNKIWNREKPTAQG